MCDFFLHLKVFKYTTTGRKDNPVVPFCLCAKVQGCGRGAREMRIKIVRTYSRGTGYLQQPIH